MRTLLKNGWILTIDDQMREYRYGDLVIEDDEISYVGEAQQHDDIDKEIDVQGSIIIPGMINTHCHSAMIPFRSLGDDCPDRLRRFLFPLELECMNESLTYLSSKYAIAEMLQAGITTFVDMYYFMDKVAVACSELGIRALLGETIIEQETCDSVNVEEALILAEEFIKTWKDHPLITPMIAPHATNTNSAKTLQKAMRIAQKYETMMTLHVAEMDYEMTYFEKEFNMTPVEWLYSIQCLNQHILAAHCIHVNEEDMYLMKKTGASVAHCIGSNLKAGKGIAPVKDMINYKIPVGFGSDGASSGNTLDLFTQMRLFAGTQKTKYHDRSLFPAKEIVRIATMGGAQALHLEDSIGSLEVGKKADITIVSLEGVHMFPIHDPYAALVYSAHAHDVRDVFVNGEHVLQNRKVACDMLSLRKELDMEMQDFYQQAKRRSDALLEK